MHRLLNRPWHQLRVNKHTISPLSKEFSKDMSERNAYKKPFSQNGEYENEELQ